MAKCDRCKRGIRGIPWAWIRKGKPAGELCDRCHTAYLREQGLTGLARATS